MTLEEGESRELTKIVSIGHAIDLTTLSLTGIEHPVDQRCGVTPDPAHPSEHAP